MEYEEARDLAVKQGHVVSDDEHGFFVRCKVRAYSPKRYRGFVGISGIKRKGDPLYTVVAGFWNAETGQVPFSFPLLHTADIHFAIQSIGPKQRKRITRALRRINDL